MHQLALSSRIKASRDKLYPYFFEFEKFGELHPLMQKITRTGPNTFFVNESVLLLGFIPMKPRYTAEVQEKDGAVVYISRVRKGVNLEIRFTFTEEAGGITLIREEVKVWANRIIAKILVNTIKKAHLEIFRKLETLVTT